MALRSRIRTLPVVGPGVLAGVEQYRRWRRDPVRRLRRLLGALDDVAVVQVGASDGDRQDPIRSLLLAHPGWTALLIEPFPASFATLRSNYPDESRFRLENVAIAADEGTATFHYLRPEAAALVDDLPGYVDQLGSFFADYLPAELGAVRAAAAAPFLATMAIPTARLDSVLDRNDVDRIDLLVVDTNGYDLVVLEQFDLVRFRPKVVLFEHKHLSVADRNAALRIVSAYRVTDLGDDYLCVR